MNKVSFAMVLAGLMGGASSAEAFRSHSTDNEWQSATIAALGGVGHLSENPADEFFSDPSLPASDSRKFVLQFASLNLGFSRDLVTTVSDFQEIVDSREEEQEGIQSTVKILDGVRSIFGKRLSAGMTPTFLSVKAGGFSVVPYANLFIDSDIRVPSLPRAHLTGDVFGGVGLGYAREFGAKVKWGAGLNLRPGVRGFVRGAVDASAAGDLVSSQSEQEDGRNDGTNKFATYGAGFYLPVDVGLSIRPHAAWRFNLVGRNVGGAPALNVIEGERPPVYPMRVSLGAAWVPWKNRVHEVALGTDIQDLTHLKSSTDLWYRWQWAALYRARLPFRNQTSFGLNCGLQSGYPSVGVFLDLFVAKLEISQSTREAGYYIGQKPERRMSARLSSQLSF